MTHLFYLLLILSEYLIHDNSNGTIACYIAGSAETVHCNIEGYLILFISFVLLFACKGTIFLTKSQIFI